MDSIASKEFSFTPRDFARVRRLIHERAGIALGENKQEMVYSRLTRRLRVLKLDSFETYLQQLESHPQNREWQEFTNALTTNLTSFFREQHHFPVLIRHLQERGGRGGLGLWCAASSTGEEPYSMAIAACEAFGSSNPPVKILATDIDTQVLGVAEQGIYALDRVKDLEPVMLKKYFLNGTGRYAGHVCVKPQIRQLVQFQTLNLLSENWSVGGNYDAIFCRNVMIYFDKQTQKKIVQKMAPLLKPDGLLFVGHSENLSFVSHEFTLLGKTVYGLNRKSGSSNRTSEHEEANL